MHRAVTQATGSPGFKLFKTKNKRDWEGFKDVV